MISFIILLTISILNQLWNIVLKIANRFSNLERRCTHFDALGIIIEIIPNLLRLHRILGVLALTLKQMVLWIETLIIHCVIFYWYFSLFICLIIYVLDCLLSSMLVNSSPFVLFCNFAKIRKNWYFINYDYSTKYTSTTLTSFEFTDYLFMWFVFVKTLIVMSSLSF